MAPSTGGRTPFSSHATRGARPWYKLRAPGRRCCPNAVPWDENRLEFSKLRAVCTAPRLNLLPLLLYPPYKPRHRRLMDLLLKWVV